MAGRLCPVCRQRAVPDFRFCCHWCHRRIPNPMRDAAVSAWRHRIRAPGRYAEALATVLLWYRDRAPDHPEKGIEP